MEAGPSELEQAQARHRKELKDLQARVTSKKKNATKKTRKGVNDECADLERQLRDKHAQELAALAAGPEPATAPGPPDGDASASDDAQPPATGLGKPETRAEEKLEKAAEKLRIDAADPPNKKRNRQKERMARRAAEQEAAAQRAEDEASTMTDHRARESEYMRKTFAAHGLVEKDIEPDGHCLFSAVADQLAQNAVPLGSGSSSSSSGGGGGGNDSGSGGSSLGKRKEPGYKAVRRAAADFMEAHADDFAPFLDEEADDLAAYAARMRDTADWGGQMELMALARRYGAEIRVVQDGRTERIGEDEGRASGRTLWLAYYRHGYGLGEHYNSLRRTGKAV